MSGARDDILARLTGALNATGAAAARAASARARLAASPRFPTLSRVSDTDVVAAFTARAEELGASVARVATRAEVGAAVAGFLRARALPLALKISPELASWLGDAAWSPGLSVATGSADADDLVGVGLARAGAAETGTIVMASGPDAPTKLNYLPETHIVVLPAGRLEASYEHAMDRVRGNDRSALLPRSVNWISGPSRTADIEQTLLVGVHGPKRIHIVIVESAA